MWSSFVALPVDSLSLGLYSSSLAFLFDCDLLKYTNSSSHFLYSENSILAQSKQQPGMKIIKTLMAYLVV